MTNRPLIVVETTGALLGWLAGRDWLNADEHDRLGRLRQARDRDDFRAAHHLVRQVAADWLGTDPTGLSVYQRCPRCGGPHGRPQIHRSGRAQPVHVSLAHSHGLLAAAAAAHPVGIDVETRRLSPQALAVTAPRVCSAGEWHLVRTAADPARRFAELWVAKEALVKLGAADLGRLAGLDVSGVVRAPARGDGRRTGTLSGAALTLWEDHGHPCALAEAAV